MGISDAMSADERASEFSHATGEELREWVETEGPGRFFAMILVDTGVEPAERRCWALKRESEACAELLIEFERFVSSRDGRSTRSLWLEEAPADFISKEALAASRAAGIQLSLTAWESGSRRREEPRKTAWARLVERVGLGGRPAPAPRKLEGLDRLSAELERLAAKGLAAGPVDVSKNWDGRFYELDAALACQALIERWAMEESAKPALGGHKKTGAIRRL